jgi:hypothetical protein
MFPVRYELNLHIQKKYVINLHLLTNKKPGEDIYVGPNTDASWHLY